MTNCCCLYHLSADDETSNVLKRSVKNVRSRFGSLLYIKKSYRLHLLVVFEVVEEVWQFCDLRGRF